MRPFFILNSSFGKEDCSKLAEIFLFIKVKSWLSRKDARVFRKRIILIIKDEILIAI